LSKLANDVLAQFFHAQTRHGVALDSVDFKRFHSVVYGSKSRSTVFATKPSALKKFALGKRNIAATSECGKVCRRVS
jgi:hypothetical protein